MVTIRFMPYAPELQGTGDHYVSGTDAEGYSIPNIDFIRETVQTVLDNPPDEVMTSLKLTSLEDVCEAG